MICTRGRGPRSARRCSKSCGITTNPRKSPETTWSATSRRSRSEEHTSELQSLMRISYAVFCLKKKKTRYSTQLPVNNLTSTTKNKKTQKPAKQLVHSQK